MPLANVLFVNDNVLPKLSKEFKIRASKATKGRGITVISDLIEKRVASILGATVRGRTNVVEDLAKPDFTLNTDTLNETKDQVLQVVAGDAKAINAMVEFYNSIAETKGDIEQKTKFSDNATTIAQRNLKSILSFVTLPTKLNPATRAKINAIRAQLYTSIEKLNSLDLTKVDITAINKEIVMYREALEDAVNKSDIEYTPDQIKSALFGNKTAPEARSILQKARNLSFFIEVNGQLTLAFFRNLQFKPDDINVVINKKGDGITVKFKFSAAYENKLKSDVIKKLTLASKEGVDKFLSTASILDALELNQLNNDELAAIAFDNSGSIVFARGSSKAKKKEQFTQKFNLLKASLANRGKVINTIELTALVKRYMETKMPVGPVGGRPLSSRVLTYRTGRFVKSLRLYKNSTNSIIQYNYNPVYYVHEKTSRDPRVLIAGSIREIAKRLYGKIYRVEKFSE